MLINIIGNIASGKTALGMALKKEFQAKRIDIDDIRRKFNRGMTITGENTSYEKLMDDVLKHQGKCHVIMESSGTSQYYPLILTKWSGPIFTIKLTCPLNKAKKRHEARMRQGYDLPPLPGEWNTSIDRAFYAIDANLHQAECDLMIDTGKHTAKEVVAIVRKFLSSVL